MYLVSLSLSYAKIVSLFQFQLSGLSSSACVRPHASSALIALAGPGVVPSLPLSISDAGPQITAIPCRSMLAAGQQITALK